jgi:uncharacterized cupredoxin-like copper-binding protein
VLEWVASPARGRWDVRLRAIAVSVVLTAGVVAGCGGGSDATSVDVGLTEFSVTPDPVEVDAGETELTADNIGGETHEMVVVRAASAADLPTDTDGAVDEDKIAKADQIGEIEDVEPGTERSVTFDLDAGDYVIFCNVVDDESDGTKLSHFAEGMHESFTVR